MRRIILYLPVFCLIFSGCEMFQWVAPHQLWKLNRQPAIGGEDGYFSIPAESIDATTDQNTNKAKSP